MLRLAARTALATLLAGAFFAAPAGAAVDRSPTKARFELRASHGYFVSVIGEGRWVRLSVEDDDSLAIYRVKGLVSTRRLRATFGDLGRISARFKPSGRVERQNPSKGCVGKPELSQQGLFVGRIRFRGEKGYVRVNARRVRGRVTQARSWRCERRIPDQEDSILEEAPFGFPLLSAFTPHRRLVFGAVGSNRAEKDQSSFFVGGALERHGSMRVARVTFEEGDASDFRFKGDFSEATFEPPKPFRGTATFVRHEDGTTTWAGDLTVELPGAGTVPLVGPEFDVDLSRPKTFKEFLEAFGLQGLLE